MQILKNLLQRPNRELRWWESGVFVLVGLGGFADALYLTIQHYNHVIPPCSIEGCETVLTSVYSSIFGVPVSLLGVIFYLTLVLLSLVYIDKKNPYVQNALYLFTHAGLLASLIFIYLQAFVIHAWCQYCLVSAFTSLLLWLAARFFSRRFI